VNIRGILLVIVAFMLGALAAGGIGVRVIREVDTAEDATSLPQGSTTTTTVSVPNVYQIDPDETLISSTALVPSSIEASGTDLAIGYDLVTLAPHAGIDPIEFVGGFGVITVIENEDLDHVYPRSWVVETANEVFEGGPANESTRVARFDVDEGFSISEIVDVRITEALAPFPVRAPFTLSEAEPTAEVAPGVTMELLNISDQGSTVIVQIGINLDSEEAGFFVIGDGPGWRSAFFEAEGRPRVNLTWVGGDLPEDIPLFAQGAVLVPIEGEFSVSLEGLR
jgi:hypothetical protein